MAIRSLVLYPDEPLLQVAKSFRNIGPEVAELAQDMFETMRVHQGCGLAGPQVGILKRIITADDGESPPLCLVNPEILEKDGEETGEEGCLSLPEIYAPVSRATSIRVRGLDPYGARRTLTAAGLLARIIQHEIDHLEGIVFLDRTDILSRQAKLIEWEDARERLLAVAGS